MNAYYATLLYFVLFVGKDWVLRAKWEGRKAKQLTCRMGFRSLHAMNSGYGYGK